jgi:galactokinase
MQSAEDRAVGLFRRTFGGEPDGIANAPGRVNLIGDHTDYNDGFVLPMAIDRATVVAFSDRADSTVDVVSEHGDRADFDLTSLAHGEPQWAEYLRGMAWSLGAAGEGAPRGWDGAIASDVPIGAGLSSSAALEMAAGMIIDRGTQPPLSRADLARAAQRAEREWVGMECGIMDQMVVASAVGGHALLLDCRSLDTVDVPIPADVAVVVLDTSTRRELTSSAYNERRATCDRVAEVLGVDRLRDADMATLAAARDLLTGTEYRRARHVITENRRVLEAAEALTTGDAELVGRMMSESHESLRDDYEVSSGELDAIVGAAMRAPACLGARMTGAGFGGCGVAIVRRDALDDFLTHVADDYRERTGLEASLYACEPSPGASMAPAD